MHQCIHTYIIHCFKDFQVQFLKKKNTPKLSVHLMCLKEKSLTQVSEEPDYESGSFDGL